MAGRRISVYKYYAENNPEGAVSLLKQYNVNPQYTKDRKGIQYGLKVLADKKKDTDEFRTAFAEIHPDKEFILDQLSKKQPIDNEPSPVMFANADGGNSEAEKINSQDRMIFVKNLGVGLLVGFGVTLGLVGIIKMVR